MNGHVVTASYPDMPSSHALQLLISHIDFWPSSQNRVLRACDALFEPFSALVERANKWLMQFPECELISVETGDKKVIYVKDIYSSSTYFSDEEHQMAIHIKGLRLWYRPTPGLRGHPSQLGFMDTVPVYLNPGEKHPKFETLPTTVERINRKLSENPLPGRVLSVETVILKIPEVDWSQGLLINPIQSRWFDEYNTHQLCFIRIFYEKGAPAHEAIGVHDFHPETLDEGSLLHPAKYSPFSALVKKASCWMQKNQSLRVTNMQTLDTKHRKKSENKGQRFDTDKVFEFQIEDRFRAYYLRLGYAHRLERMSPDMHPLTSVPKLTFREYLPIKKENGYENITELLQKLDDLIRRKDVPVLHIETVGMPEWITTPSGGTRELGERTFFDGEWYFTPDQDGNDKGPYRYTIIYCLRVYFDGLEDAAFMRMQSRSISNSGNSCCNVL